MAAAIISLFSLMLAFFAFVYCFRRYFRRHFTLFISLRSSPFQLVFFIFAIADS
jgi:hypothetical protein